MIIRLYNPIGTSVHGDDIELPDEQVPRIGEWLRFHINDSRRLAEVYRIVSVEHVLNGSSRTIFVSAYEAHDQHLERAKAAIHDEHAEYQG